MKSIALVTSEAQEFTLEEVTIPEPAADDIVIETLYSGVSVGTEFGLIRKKIS